MYPFNSRRSLLLLLMWRIKKVKLYSKIISLTFSINRHLHPLIKNPGFATYTWRRWLVSITLENHPQFSTGKKSQVHLLQRSNAQTPPLSLACRPATTLWSGIFSSLSHAKENLIAAFQYDLQPIDELLPLPSENPIVLVHLWHRATPSSNPCASEFIRFCVACSYCIASGLCHFGY